jgi:regulator of nucleoside diphosphate kinase
MKNPRRVHITQNDRDRIEKLLGQPQVEPDDVGYLDALRGELERAVIVAPEKIPADVVTMNSVVSIVDEQSHEEDTYTLVYPEEADIEVGKVSVMAPLGTAMLGYRVGDVFEWTVPAGKRRWRIASVEYQPEAAGKFD